MRLGLFIIVALHSCAYWLSGGESVVERSKSQRPAWVDQKPNVFILESEQFLFHYHSENLPDLPIALKITQRKSIEAAENGLKDLIRSALTSKVAQETISSAYAIQEYSVILNHVTKAGLTNHVKSQDIYFEKLENEKAPSNELKEYFRVHTLHIVTKSDFSILLLELATRCIKSTNPKVKKLGQDLNASLISSSR